VWKDLVAARRVLWLVLPLGAAQVAGMSFVPEVYLMAAVTFSAVLGFGSIALEEYHGTELLWNSLPVTRGQFVGARYLTTLAGTVTGLGLSWALAQTVRAMATDAAAGPDPLLGPGAHAVLFGFLVLVAAVYLPLCVRFGTGRGLLYLSAVAVAALAVLSLAAERLAAAKGSWRALLMGAVEWIEPRFALLVTLWLAAGALAMAISLMVARRLYQGRDL
jgi:hypothetical protein